MVGKRIRRTMVVLMLMALYTWLGPAPAEWTEVHGESKGRVTMPRETARDPFALPPGVHLLSKSRVLPSRAPSVKPEIRSPDWPRKLTAILISDYVRLASIDRNVLTVGDFIYGERVLEIQPDRVILEKGANKRTLLLSQTSLRLKVEEKRGENR